MKIAILLFYNGPTSLHAICHVLIPQIEESHSFNSAGFSVQEVWQSG